MHICQINLGGVKKLINRLIFYTLIYPKVKWLNAYKNRFLKYYVKTYNICDAFVVLCDGYRKEWENLFGLSSSNKIRVIPNSERILEYVQLKKKKQILYSGRMSHEDKRIDRLLKIWREISYKIPEWEFVLVGDGPSFKELKEMAQRYKLERISFVGYVSDVSPYYDDASILCLTSDFEGWGLCLTEAQAHGVVPIAMNCSAGVASILSPSGVNGILIPPGDVKIFAKKLLDLIKDPIRLETMRLNVLEKAKSYSVDETKMKWVNLFDSLLKSDKS